MNTKHKTTSKGETTRNKIIGLATFLINKKGYSNTSIQDVIENVGIKKGSFYFHFASKEELGYAVIENASSYILDKMWEITRQDDLQPLQKLEAMLREVQNIIEITNCEQGCVLGNLALEMSHLHDGFRKKMAEVFNGWSSLFAVVLEEMKLSDELPEDFDCSAYADFIISALEGGIMMSKVSLDPSPMRNAIALIIKQLENLRPAPDRTRKGEGQLDSMQTPQSPERRDQ